MRLSLLGLALAAACAAPSPGELDDAGEAVVRHLAGQLLDSSPDGPWAAVCLRREPGPEQDDEAAFLARFGDLALPVVPSRRCRAADEGYAWVVEGTGKPAFEVRLGPVLEAGNERLVLEAATSTATMDYALHECTLERDEEGWRVLECRVTILT